MSSIFFHSPYSLYDKSFLRKSMKFELDLCKLGNISDRYKLKLNSNDKFQCVTHS
jgi:hypothetical protein